MKKIICLVLVLALTAGMATTALAVTDYNSSLLKGLNMTPASMVATADTRVLTCVVALLVYAEVLPSGTDIFSQISYFGTAKVANWGSSVDVYLPTNDGRYYNLFMMPASGKVQDYGITSTVSTMQTYYDVPMSQVATKTLEILESVKK